MNLTRAEVVPVRPWEVCGVDGEDEFLEIKLDVEEEEAREPRTLRDPGAPTEAEVEQHNVTHLPFRAWCPACVEGKARDRPHRKQEGEENKNVPEVVFDYGFLGAEGEETIAIQVARDRRTKMVFAHVVPRKGFTHEHGAEEMVKDLKKLGYSEVVLKCDGEPALKSVQEEVKRRRPEPTILENSPVGDSRSNGAAEQAVQAVGEQVRVLRRGLEQRLGVKLSGKHPVMSWLVEHAADLLSRYQVGDDGRTGYERLKGKKCKMEMVEFGEKVHYRFNPKSKPKEAKLEVKWGEGFFLGKWWRTGEAVIGTQDGILRAGSIRRVGGHRRWDREGLDQVRGVPWQWDPEQGQVHADLKVRWLKEEEVASGNVVFGGEPKGMYRLRLRKRDFLKYGFTEGCVGCQAMIAGTNPRGHTEACRNRMNKALQETDEGRQRLERQSEKENEYLARKLEENCGGSDAGQAAKKARVELEGLGGSGASSSSSGGPGKRKDMSEDPDQVSLSAPKVPRAAEEERGKKRQLEDEEPEMEVSIVERTMQEDMRWSEGLVSDMCMPDDADLQRSEVDLQYFDENTWEVLDSAKVVAAERAELMRFAEMGVYERVPRAEALNDPDGKFVKVKWVRTNKGSAEDQVVKCRLVAQELGYGQRMDELFSGTPSLMAVKVALAHAARGGPHYGIMIMDVKAAFLYGECRRKIYIELPTQDPCYGDGGLVGKLRKAMYGTRDAPQIWQREVQKSMESIGFSMSILQPSVYYHRGKRMVVVVHVDDFLCSGNIDDLEWLYQSLVQKYDMKRDLIRKDTESELRYLNRRVRWKDGQFELEGDEKHVSILMKEWGMDQCKEVDTPISRSCQDQALVGDLLSEEEAKRTRRAIARINFMAQDRPDLSVVARIMSQGMAQPREGVRQCVKRAIRYLRKFPRCILEVGSSESFGSLEVWTDSDWAGDSASRKSCSGGSLQLNGTTVQHWSKLQSNVALSSGEAELNSAVKGVSEAIGLQELIKEVFDVHLAVRLNVDASACRGILLRQGSGKVKHLTTKQLWVQGAIQSYGLEVRKVSRECNSADILTHPTSEEAMAQGLQAMGMRRSR